MAVTNTSAQNKFVVFISVLTWKLFAVTRSQLAAICPSRRLLLLDIDGEQRRGHRFMAPEK
jgi:hypothetical protein